MSETSRSASPQVNPTFYKKASFPRRTGAFLLDLIILYLLLILVMMILQTLAIKSPVPDWVISLLYGILFIWKTGATPGKKLFEIKVVSTDGKPVSFWNALLRESVGKGISIIVFGMGFLWMLLDKKNQTWHDKMADTVVVQSNGVKNLSSADNEEAITTIRKIAFWTLLLLNPLTIANSLLIIYIFFFRPFQITGKAMSPTLNNNGYVLTNIISLKFQDPQRGDIIIFKAPIDPNKDSIKRVIGVPGDKVKLNKGSVYINDQLIDESGYLNPQIITFGGALLPENQEITVPQQNYFVLGDNRSFSSDSREWGFVPRKNIISKVEFCYWNCDK